MERKKEASKREITSVYCLGKWLRSRPTPEVRGSNPVIGKIYMYYQLY